MEQKTDLSKKNASRKTFGDYWVQLGENLTFLMFSIMVVIVFVNVIGRFFFQAGITESEELSKILFVWITFIGIVLCFREGKHIAVDILLLMLPEKTRRIFDIISNILTTVILGVVAYYGIDFVKTSAGMVSPLTRIPQPFIHLILPISLGFMIIINMGNLWKLLKNKVER